jgi:hypothetical protein
MPLKNGIQFKKCEAQISGYQLVAGMTVVVNGI